MTQQSKYALRFAKVKEGNKLTVKSATQQLLSRASDWLELSDAALNMREKLASKDAAIWREARELAVNYVRLGAKEAEA